MTALLSAYVVVLLVGASLLVRQWRSTRRRALSHADILRSRAGDEAPPTLHPVIDPVVCIGSGGCVKACPEQLALVVVDGRGHLADPAGCVGHGACKDACPVNAITLVFGSSRRGVELPELDRDFQTNVPGLYIAGELGGMGLVSNSVRQGVKAVDAIAASLAAEGAKSGDGVLPLLVIGAGPAGIGATLAAREKGLAVRTIDQAPEIGGTVRTYARQKIVMTQPVLLPLYGRVRLHRTSKEALIELWNDVIDKSGLEIEFDTRLAAVEKKDGVFVAQTTKGEIRARRVLLAAGRRGTPRRMGVPGDDLPHVHARLDDPAEHAGEPCVVVGGGDAAVEAALALAEQPDTKVILCHRGKAFDRCRPANRARLENAEMRRVLVVMRSTVVARVHEGEVELSKEGCAPQRFPARRIFALLGAEIPVSLLKSAGVKVRTHYGDKVV
jgi:thioredoxin reductase/ferredoxin